MREELKDESLGKMLAEHNVTLQMRKVPKFRDRRIWIHCESEGSDFRIMYDGSGIEEFCAAVNTHLNEIRNRCKDYKAETLIGKHCVLSLLGELEPEVLCGVIILANRDG